MSEPRVDNEHEPTSWSERLRAELVTAAQREVDREVCRRGRLRDPARGSVRG